MKKTVKKQDNFKQVHYSVKNRKIFKRNMWLIFLALIAVLVVCAVMFYFGGVVWDPDAGFKPTPNIKYSYQYALIVFGAVICFAAIILWSVYSIRKINKFYKTQEEYFKTPEFAKAKAKALKADINKMKKKDIKWYKKMGYITAEEKNKAIEASKNYKKQCKKESKKISYAESKA